MRSRLLTISAFLVIAVIAGGADGCAGDPNVEGAKLYLRQGEFDQALERLDVALQANPANVDALLLKVDVLGAKAEKSTNAVEQSEILQMAATTLTSARQVAPDDPRVGQKAITIWALGVNKGNTALRAEGTDPSVAISMFTLATQALPDSSQGYYGLGLAHLRAGAADKAVPALRSAIEKDPAVSSSYYFLGRALLASDQGTEAVGVLEDAATRFPDDDDIQTALLSAYTTTGDTEGAIVRYERAVQNNPDDAALRYNYGALLLQASRPDEAIPQLEMAVELAPDNPDAHYNLGAAFQNKAAKLNEEANTATDDDTANRLLAERNTFLERSVAPLVKARELSSDEDEAGICRALFQVYGKLNRIEEAREAAECGGMSMN